MDKRPDHITFRISPAAKAKLQAIARAEHRPLSNLVALIVDKYLESREPGTGVQVEARKE